MDDEKWREDGGENGTEVRSPRIVQQPRRESMDPEEEGEVVGKARDEQRRKAAGSRALARRVRIFRIRRGLGSGGRAQEDCVGLSQSSTR